MKNSWACGFMCLLTLLVVVVLCGCTYYNQPELQRRRSYTIDQDLKHLADDVDWVLGLDKPAPFDESMR